MRRILHVGAGVWVCLRKSMKLILVHTTTHKILQEVNVKSNFINILKSMFVIIALSVIQCNDGADDNGQWSDIYWPILAFELS